MYAKASPPVSYIRITVLWRIKAKMLGLGWGDCLDFSQFIGFFLKKKNNKPLQTLKRSESVFSFARVYLDAVS